MKPILLFFLFFQFFLSTQAEVLKFDVSGYKRNLFKYQDVCKEMGVEHLLLVEVIDPLHLDCMGKKTSVKNFCLKKLEEEQKGRFLRGYINSKLGEVVCEMGDEALVSIGCDKRDKNFCKNPTHGCLKLKNIYAHSHVVNYHSFIEKDVDDVLNCYFSLPQKLKETKVTLPNDPLPFEEKPIIDRDIFDFDRNPKQYLNAKSSK